MMKVSICITYYNQENFVRQSLDSVFAIDFPCEYEVLCHDDGSNDNTRGILELYEQKHVGKLKCYIQERNENEKSINRASASRLRLAEKASGDFILFLDGDDYYCNTQFIKEALLILLQNTSIAACAFNYKYLMQDGTYKEIAQNIPKGINKAKDYIKNRCYTHSGAIVFRNYLNRERLNLLKSINNFDDNAITIYFLQFGDLYFFDKTVYVYRQTNDSLWNSISLMERNIIEAMDYRMILESAPKFGCMLAARLYPAFRFLYKHKKDNDNLGERRDKYLQKIMEHGDCFLAGLLRWRSLTSLEKLLVRCMWLIYKVKAGKYNFILKANRCQ